MQGFFYGVKPSVLKISKKDLAKKGYNCCALFQNKQKQPVVVAHNEKLDIWMVQNGFSSVFFGSKEDASDYCNEHFSNADN